MRDVIWRQDVTLLWVGEPEDVTSTKDDSAASLERRLVAHHFTVDVTQCRVERTQRHGACIYSTSPTDHTHHSHHACTQITTHNTSPYSISK